MVESVDRTLVSSRFLALQGAIQMLVVSTHLEIDTLRNVAVHVFFHDAHQLSSGKASQCPIRTAYLTESFTSCAGAAALCIRHGIVQ